MGFTISPGVSVSEIDLTNVIPAVASTPAAFAGMFRWGPVLDIVTLEGENQLVSTFGKPNDATAVSFFTAASYLAYSGVLRLVRVVGSGALNSTSEATTGSGTAGTGLLIKNDDQYDQNYLDGSGNVGLFAARFPGKQGNSLRVSLCPSADAFSKTWEGATSDGTSVTITGVTHYATIAFVGSTITQVGTGEVRTITAITDITDFTIDEAFSVDMDDEEATIDWQYKQQVAYVPGTSDFVLNKGGANDEMNIVVIDEDGSFTGIIGTVLERWPLVSKASDAKAHDGASNYYKDVLNRRSKYVRWMDHLPAGSNWGNEALGTTYTAVAKPVSYSLAGGADGSAASDGDLITGFDMFANAETVDVGLIIGGEASADVAAHLIQEICEVRIDCIALLSPPKDAVVANPGSEVEDVVTFRNNLPSSSYAVLDSGWKSMYDKYNDVYRFVPLCGDVAGLCARTDKDRDPWFSPAGLNRGQIKNVTKLAFSPNEADRDDLYVVGVNPVVSFPGQGTVLFGDKTLLSRPSAFDRINVRRLFIVMEKSISKAARFSLFEFNDEFTRAQFRSMVEPFLRDIKGRRGITDFRVVCDSSNNTAEVINNNQFVGDIYVRPNYSINFIKLNFIAVRNGVEFDEIVGKF